MPEMENAFGPVPSRRLGRSLGINNIPPKTCTYSCVYCQLGRTDALNIQRRPFYAPGDVFVAVQEKMRQSQVAGETIDYLTFVPDGEPTLDIQLGRTIERLRPLGIPIAVICNTSLVWQPEVRADLCMADWVSLKLDAVTERVWRKIDRPHATLSLGAVTEGAYTFAHAFSGKLVTETMVVAGVNDDVATVTETAGFIATLHPSTAYLAVPTRPPAEAWVRPPDEAALNRAYQIFAEHVDHVEYLIGYEGSAFAHTGDVVRDILAITAVHPMRADALDAFLARAGTDWSVVRGLVTQGSLDELAYARRTFYLRRLHD